MQKKFEQPNNKMLTYECLHLIKNSIVEISTIEFWPLICKHVLDKQNS